MSDGSDDSRVFRANRIFGAQLALNDAGPKLGAKIGTSPEKRPSRELIVPTTGACISVLIGEVVDTVSARKDVESKLSWNPPSQSRCIRLGKVETNRYLDL